MKLDRLRQLLQPREELIAEFGRARLVRKADGKIELEGGSASDRRKAREWMAVFWREWKAPVRE